MQCLISLFNGLTGYIFPLYHTKPVHASTLHIVRNWASWCQVINCAHDTETKQAGSPHFLRPSLSSLPETSADSIFSDRVPHLALPVPISIWCIPHCICENCSLQTLHSHHTSSQSSMSCSRLCLLYILPSHSRNSHSVWQKVMEKAPLHNHQDLACAIWSAYVFMNAHCCHTQCELLQW